VAQVLVLELVFRVFVPAATAPVEYQHTPPPVMALDREAKTEGTYTVGRLARDKFKWKVNNAGFNSNHEYKSASERNQKCIAVIGSSYVQGFYSDVDAHFSASLEDRLDDQTVVYNLGTSGMPLSQAINVITYARQSFQPDLFIIEVSNGSLRQSIRNNGFVPFSKQFRFSENSVEEIEASAYTKEKFKNLLRKSAIVRYLIYNANLNLGGGVARPASKKAKDIYYSRAAETIIPRLRQAAGPNPILLFSDADRKSLYLDPETVSPLAESLVLSQLCQSEKIPFLDLTDGFKTTYSKEGRKFNFAENYHWNPYGVAVVSHCVYDYMKSLDWIKPDGTFSPSAHSMEQ